jgi:hypothetical protein
MALLDFSNPLVTDASVGMSAEPGSSAVVDPTTGGLIFPSPVVSGAVTGVVNAMGQTVQSFFNQLPVAFGLATPQPISPLAQLGGMGMGTILLIGLGVYLLAKKN